MKSIKVYVPALVSLFLFLLMSAGYDAVAADREKEFESTIRMKVGDLTSASKALLERKYAGEDWEKHKFPRNAYISEAVLLGYKIAVKESELLAKFPCYCFCEAMGHKNLAYCYLKGGVPGTFDLHASTCNTCVKQAMHAFLWNDLGIPLERMSKAMKETYQR